jgi:hypothetical protein
MFHQRTGISGKTSPEMPLPSAAAKTTAISRFAADENDAAIARPIAGTFTAAPTYRGFGPCRRRASPLSCPASSVRAGRQLSLTAGSSGRAPGGRAPQTAAIRKPISTQ